MQEFFICKGSINPLLRVEPIYDGRFDFKKSLLNSALEGSISVLFSMCDEETGILKISKAPAEVVLAKTDGCEDRYIIQYRWNERDVKKEGFFKGWFEIKFNENLTDGDGTDYPKGNLIIPIQEDLRIIIK